MPPKKKKELEKPSYPEIEDVVSSYFALLSLYFFIFLSHSHPLHSFVLFVLSLPVSRFYYFFPYVGLVLAVGVMYRSLHSINSGAI